eukprot:1153050-Pelagomonas_calceolata.AAC.3
MNVRNIPGTIRGKHFRASCGRIATFGSSEVSHKPYLGGSSHSTRNFLVFLSYSHFKHGGLHAIVSHPLSRSRHRHPTGSHCSTLLAARSSQ